MIHDQVKFVCYQCAWKKMGVAAAGMKDSGISFCRLCGQDGPVALVEEIKLSGLTEYQEAKKKRLGFYLSTDAYK